MKILRSLRWAVLLLGVIGVVAAALVAAFGQSLQSRSLARAADVFVSKDVVADILPPPMYLIELRLVLSRALEGTLTAEQAGREVDRLAGEYEARVVHWQQHPPPGSLLQPLTGRQHDAGQRFIAAARTGVVTPLLAGDKAAAAAQLPALDRLYLEHRAGVDETVVAANRVADDAKAGFAAEQRRATIVSAVALAAAVVLVLLCYRVVLASIQRPLRACSDLARRVAAGDLAAAAAQASAEPRSDAIGELQTTLVEMCAGLISMIGTVRQAADSVVTASVQIEQGNGDLSRRTEEQSSSLQQTAASAEQLGTTTQHNAEGARQASQLAQGAAGVATRGGDVVGRVVATMKAIDGDSRRIADIVGTIDGIAFQTNILALNAAVEAARAGEQGRGFAVVASEVRSLAQRSAEAAREIKSLIAASVDRVAQGTALADEAGATMGEVVASIARVTDLVAEISSASHEQASGVAQVSQAVGRMDSATQQNAALVEESAAAASSLRDQAQQLAQTMARFRVA